MEKHAGKEGSQRSWRIFLTQFSFLFSIQALTKCAHTAQSVYTCDIYTLWAKEWNRKRSQCLLAATLPSGRAQSAPPGQVHAAVSEAGGGIEVLPAGSQHQVGAPLVLHPVRGSPLLGGARRGAVGLRVAMHHLPRQADVFKATGAQEAFCKYLGKTRT